MKKFPKKFIFSTSAYSYQIEGGRLLGGRQYSNWDKFTIENYHIPPEGEPIREISSIDIATDFYHRYKEDINIMKEIGVNGFVYGLDWARIFPENDETINEEGIAFYEDVFKTLIENGIKPMPVLYHWDTPLWLEKMGGASSRTFLNSFRKFSKIIFERLGKYSDTWYVNSENSTYTISSYLDDYNPPRKKDEKEFWKAIYYLSISAAAAKEEFELAKTNGFLSKKSALGIIHNWTPSIPYDDNDEDDLKACKIFDEYNLELFLNPNILGKFPKCFDEAIDKLDINSIIDPKDLKLIKKYKLDLIGWNYCSPSIIASPKRMSENIKWNSIPKTFITKDAYVVFPEGKEYTSWNLLVMSNWLSKGANILWNNYKKPLMITENGLGHFDKKEEDVINDDYRIYYLNEHLAEVQKSLEMEIPFIGYSLRSYCDIFSSTGGYRKKYGLVGIDFENKTLSRFPKSSMFWYKEVINSLTTIEQEKIDYNKYYEEAKKSYKKSCIWLKK